MAKHAKIQEKLHSLKIKLIDFMHEFGFATLYSFSIASNRCVSVCFDFDASSSSVHTGHQLI